VAPFSSHDVLTVFIQDCAQRHLKIILGGHWSWSWSLYHASILCNFYQFYFRYLGYIWQDDSMCKRLQLKFFHYCSHESVILLLVCIDDNIQLW